MPNILTNLVQRQASKYGDRPAYSFKAQPNGAWAETSWTEFSRKVDAASYALEILGIEPGDTVGVFSANRPDILITDFAAFANRAVPVSIYATSSQEQVEYIVNDARVSILFVGNRDKYSIALEAKKKCKRLSQIVCYEEFPMEEKDKETLSRK